MPVEEHDSRRKQQYKNVAKHEDMRRRRTEGSLELRKQKKDDQLMKRRNVGVAADDTDLSDIDTTAVNDQPAAAPYPKLTPAEAVAILSNSPSLEQMSYTFEAIRRMLSRTREPPVQEIIDAGLLNALVQGLTVPDNKVQFEAAWALTNVVSGSSEQTFKAVEAGVVEPLVKLCCSPHLPVAEQATWAMANIAGDCGQLRDQVIAAGGAEALLFLTAKVKDLGVEFVRTMAWAYSNMCRHKNPQTSIDVLRKLAPGIAVLLSTSDKVVVQDSCWALSYMTDGPDEQIELALHAGVLPRVVELLDLEENAMIAPALRVLGNFVTGNDVLTQVVVDSGVLQNSVGKLIQTKSSAIVKECCWFISNVIAGTQTQIQAVIDANLLPLLIQVLDKGNFKCQYEAGWALANLAQGGTAQQVYRLYQLGAVGPMCRALLAKNSEFVINVLDTLFAILRASESIYPTELDKIRLAIEEAEGLDFMERLQEHENVKVYDTAYKIIDNFFNDEEEENKENMHLENMESVVAPSEGFQF